jgi:hypothetical protein
MWSPNRRRRVKWRWTSISSVGIITTSSQTFALIISIRISNYSCRLTKDNKPTAMLRHYQIQLINMIANQQPAIKKFKYKKIGHSDADYRHN